MDQGGRSDRRCGLFETLYSAIINALACDTEGMLYILMRKTGSSKGMESNAGKTLQGRVACKSGE